MGYFQGGHTVQPNIEKLRSIKTFSQLVKYLRDELDWPIDSENFDDLTFDYEPEELGIDAGTAVKIKEIKQFRPLVSNQPWGIFFINFEPKRLPIVVLRRILRSLVVKKRSWPQRPIYPYGTYTISCSSPHMASLTIGRSLLPILVNRLIGFSETFQLCVFSDGMMTTQ